MYKSSAKVIQLVLEKKGDIKTILYQQNKSINTAVHALVYQTLKYREVLEEIISLTPNVSKQYNHKKNKQFKGLILLLIYELLFGAKNKLLSSSSSSKRFNQLIINNKNSLNSALVRIKIKKQISNNQDLIQSNLSQIKYIYGRINTVLTTSNIIIQKLINDHNFNYYKNEKHYKNTIENNNNNNNNSNIKAFWNDEHIANLLVFTTDCKIAKLSICIDGYIIIQNKSSCIPAFIMDPKPNWFILDGCASPGNKTSHLMCIINDNYNKNKNIDINKQCIVALDHDKKRCNILQERINLFGMNKNINVLHKDFLSISPSSIFARKFNAILLDPTCSGSGLINDRIGHYDNDKKLKIPKLSEMQKKMILHAMKFENVQKIVYSTCSVNKEENEDVIHYALNHCDNKFEIINIFNQWKQRGIDGYSFSDFVVRVNNDNDRNLHGFFVACFQRKKHNKNGGHKRNLDQICSMQSPAKRRKLINNDKCLNKSKKWKVNIKCYKSHVVKKWRK